MTSRRSADPTPHGVGDSTPHGSGDPGFRAPRPVRVDPVSDLSGNPHDRGLPPSALPLRWQQVFVSMFVVLLVITTLFLVTEHWRRATFLFGASLLYLASARMLCDSRVLGVLAVRSRRFDVIFTLCLGGMMMFMAASIDSLGS